MKFKVLSSRQNKRFSVRICRNLIFEFISTVSNRKCGEIVRSRKFITYGFQQSRGNLGILKSDKIVFSRVIA